MSGSEMQEQMDLLARMHLDAVTNGDWEAATSIAGVLADGATEMTSPPTQHTPAQPEDGAP